MQVNECPAEKKGETAFVQREHQELWCFTSSAVFHTTVMAVTMAVTAAVTMGVTDTVHASCNIALKLLSVM